MARPPDHGMTKTTEFKIWQGVHQRCYNPNSTKYYLYGGRGIKVEDDRWFKFIDFYKDMGKRPNGLTLDRIDTNKGYYKDNCRWATAKQQNSNRRNVTMLEHEGVTMPLKYWADKFNLSVPCIRHRIKMKWDTVLILTHPLIKGKTKSTLNLSEQL